MPEWTQPVCIPCWCAYSFGMHGELVIPTRLRTPEHERCVFCLRDTTSGIYLRVNPKSIVEMRQWCESINILHPERGHNE